MAIQKQKANFFEEKITDFFEKTGRSELPWRKRGITAYEVWVSEVMLQQTQVSRVTVYYTRFLKKFPTVEKLAKATWEEFLPYYEGLGYYARGRNMLKTAQIVTKEYKGIFPQEKEVLITLPGIGDYTASAILSFAYTQDVLAWDTNLKRVIGRFFYGNKKAEINTLFFEETFTEPRKKLNAALMDFGSLVCTGKPKCANCPLQKKCEYSKTNGTLEAQKKEENIQFPLTEARVIIFLHQEHKVYYSLQKNNFEPFILPAGYQTREAVKAWFLEQHGLRVAVRPLHKKTYLKKAPVLLVNAQILLGEHHFYAFSKKQVTEYTKGKKL
jgi:A/G-specific adenine glycosylase